MITVYLVCFVLGLVLSVLAAVTGLGRLHFGHVHVGHVPAGQVQVGRLCVRGGAGGLSAHAAPGATQIPALNGFTLTAFLCWFGGVGYLLTSRSPLIGPLVLLAAVVSGMIGATAFYGLIFKLLLPRERVMAVEDTRMEGVLARISDEVRAKDGIGEILFSQGGTRRSAPARSEDGQWLPRGTEVVVLRYERGVATVRAMGELEEGAGTFKEGRPGEKGDVVEKRLPTGD